MIQVVTQNELDSEPKVWPAERVEFYEDLAVLVGGEHDKVQLPMEDLVSVGGEE